MTFQSTKEYGHNLGLSCAFRQHGAESHCRFIHGYALAIKLVFQADVLNSNGWVVDFGSLVNIKKSLQDRFDHKLLVAENDPKKDEIYKLNELGIAQVIVVPATGCEAFARQIYFLARQWLIDNFQSGRVKLVSVEVKEHGANSAIYLGEEIGQ